MNQEKELDAYRKKNLFGNISLFFFFGLYILFIQIDMNWPGIIFSGILMFASWGYVIYNDYQHNKRDKIKEKLIGTIATILFAIIALIITMYYYDISLSVLF